MKLKWLFLFIALPLLFISCGGKAVLISNVSPEINSGMHRPFVLISGDEASDKYFFILKEKLLEEFKKLGINAEIFVYDSLSLETESSIEKMKNNCRPDMFIEIKQTDLAVFPYSNIIIEIIITKMDKMPIWRAQLKTAGFSRHEMNAQQTAGELIKALKRDALIKEGEQKEGLR